MKKFFTIALTVFLVLIMAIPTYAEKRAMRYPNGYVMNCELLHVSTILGGGSGASTSTNDYAVAFVSLFVYRGNTITNYDTKEQFSYVYTEIKNKGGNRAVSTHSLKYGDGRPCGDTLKIELR